MKKIANFVLFLFIFGLMTYSFSVEARAEYAQTITVDNSSKDIAKALSRALKDARDIATVDGPVKVVVPAGNYDLSTCVRIYSNTTLDATGCTFTRLGSGVALATGGLESDPQHSGYIDYQNIKVIGGTWIKQADNISNVIYLIHGTNISIEGCTIDGSEGEKPTNNHLIEASAINGLTVKNCTFRNNVRPAADIAEDTYCGGWECLQLDITTEISNSKSTAVHNYIYDGTPSKNITIEGNTFEKASRGIGTHTAIKGVYIENVNIKNNQFIGLTDEAVVGFHWYKINIENNTIDGGRGIFLQNMGKISSSGSVDTFALLPATEPDPGVYEVRDLNNIEAKIINNTITTSSKMISNCSYGIDIYGATTTKVYNAAPVAGVRGKLPAGNYEISGIEISGNKITTNGVGIRTRGCYDSKIYNNEIISKGTAYADTQVCGVSAYSGTTQAIGISIYDNNVTGFRDAGILAKNGACIQNITGNTIKGTDNDGIRISDSATVLGNIEKNTISDVKGAGIVVKSSAASKSVVENTITNVELSGILISDEGVIDGNINSNTITNAKDNAIETKQASVKGSINENVIPSSVGFGIYIKASTVDGEINKNNISKTTLDGIRVADTSSLGGSIINNVIDIPTGAGIVVKDPTSVKSIELNTINSATIQGILVAEKSNILENISNNQILNSKDSGLLVKSANVGGNISDNTVTKPGDFGVYVKDSSVNGDIYMNTITSAKSDAIRVAEKSTLGGAIEKNVISSPKAAGIAVKGSNVAGILSNKIKSTGGPGILLADKASVTSSGVIGNSITNPKDCGIDIKDSTLKGKLESNTIKNANNYGLRIITVKNNLCINKNTIGAKKTHTVYVRAESDKYLITLTGNTITAASKFVGVRIDSGKIYVEGNTIKGAAIPFCTYDVVKGEIYANTIKDNTNAKYYLSINRGSKQVVNPSKLSGVKVTPSKGKVTIKWKTSNDADGYEIRYSKSKNMTSAKSADVPKASTSKTTITKLSKKTYYFEIRAYKVSNGVKVLGEPVVIKANVK